MMLRLALPLRRSTTRCALIFALTAVALFGPSQAANAQTCNMIPGVVNPADGSNQPEGTLVNISVRPTGIPALRAS
jgi:hypothetical protein